MQLCIFILHNLVISYKESPANMIQVSCYIEMSYHPKSNAGLHESWSMQYMMTNLKIGR